MSNKSRTRASLCSSKHTRTNLYRATAILRAFAFLEFDRFRINFEGICTPSEIFNKSKINADLSKFSTDWWITVRHSHHRGYVHSMSFRKASDLFSSLALTALVESDFNSDWTLTEQGQDFCEAMRRRWQHKIKIQNECFYFCSARQLTNILMDHMEDFLTDCCNRFTEQLDKEVDTFFGDIELDELAAVGGLLREAFGVRKMPEHYGLMMSVRQALFSKGYEKNASKLIQLFSEEPAENLVSENYLERLVGLIQAQSLDDL